MNWSRAKSILIIVFVLVNIFLIYNLKSIGRTVPADRARFDSVLLNNGVEYSGEPETKERVVRALLPVEASGELGRTLKNVDRRNFAKKINGALKKEKLAVEGISYLPLDFAEENGAVNAVLTPSADGYPVFNETLSVRIAPDGRAELSGYLFEFQEKQYFQILSKEEIILEFIAGDIVTGAAAKVIEAVEAGYIRKDSSGVIPAYRIVFNGQTYYYDARINIKESERIL